MEDFLSGLGEFGSVISSVGTLNESLELTENFVGTVETQISTGSELLENATELSNTAVALITLVDNPLVGFFVDSAVERVVDSAGEIVVDSVLDSAGDIVDDSVLDSAGDTIIDSVAQSATDAVLDSFTGSFIPSGEDENDGDGVVDLVGSFIPFAEEDNDLGSVLGSLGSLTTPQADDDVAETSNSPFSLFAGLF